MGEGDDNRPVVLGDIKTLWAELRGINDKLKSLTGEVGALYDAMPENEHGEMDKFGHRLDHKDWRDDRIDRRATRSDIKRSATEIITKLAIGLTIATVLGEKALTIVEHLH